MQFEPTPLYPACPTITRTVNVGGRTKAELLQDVQHNAIAMTESAQRLFASDDFTTSETRYRGHRTILGKVYGKLK